MSRVRKKAKKQLSEELARQDEEFLSKEQVAEAARQADVTRWNTVSYFM